MNIKGTEGPPVRAVYRDREIDINGGVDDFKVFDREGQSNYRTMRVDDDFQRDSLLQGDFEQLCFIIFF